MNFIPAEILDDYKCCGNCRFRLIQYSSKNEVIKEECTHYYPRKASHAVCEKWHFDSLIPEERMKPERKKDIKK